MGHPKYDNDQQQAVRPEQGLLMRKKIRLVMYVPPLHSSLIDNLH
jgi:hypothetical protein